MSAEGKEGQGTNNDGSMRMHMRFVRGNARVMMSVGTFEHYMWIIGLGMGYRKTV